MKKKAMGDPERYGCLCDKKGSGMIRCDSCGGLLSPQMNQKEVI